MSRVAGDSLETRVRGELSQADLGGALLLAVSGGADSMALVELLDHPDLRSRLTIAHYDHCTRPSSAADAVFVAAEADRRGLAFVSGRSPSPAAGRRRNEGVLRKERYGFLTAEATRRNAAILTAHTLDDHAETVLACVMRDAGIGGLSGIPARSSWRAVGEVGGLVQATILRPVLGERRHHLKALLEERGLEWREDESNHDDSNLRARLRRVALPALGAACERDPVAGLSRLAELARGWSERLDRDLETLLPAGAGATLTELAALPAPVLEHWLHRQGLRWRAHARWAAHAIRAGRASRRSLPDGLELRICPDGTGLRFAPSIAPVNSPPAFPAPRLRPVESMTWPAQPGTCYLDADRLALPLAVRGRRNGDRLRPIGLGGSKLVSDLLQEQRVPREERARVPIVVDAHNRIVWVAPYRVDERFAAVAASRRIVAVELDEKPV